MILPPGASSEVGTMSLRFRLLLFVLVLALPCFPSNAAPASPHDQFRVAVYIPVSVVEKMKDPAYLEKSWQDLSSQVAVDKLYIETYRSSQSWETSQRVMGS
jgi:hypothetical protein